MHKGKLTNVNPPRITTEPINRRPPYVVSLAGLSVFILSIMPVGQSDYYSLRQWTIQSTVTDYTVHRNGLYGPLSETVIIFRLKGLG